MSKNIQTNLNMSNASDVYSNLFNFKPFYKNMFEITFYNPGTQESEGNTLAFNSDYTKYHATGITIGGESIEFERNRVTKAFHLKNDASFTSPYTRLDKITITWRENSSLDVRRFHEDWMSLFYDKEKDCFISYAVEGNKASTYLYKNAVVKLIGSEYELHLINLLPHNTASMDLAFGQDNSIWTPSVDYYIEKWYWKRGNEEVKNKGSLLLSANTDVSDDGSIKNFSSDVYALGTPINTRYPTNTSGSGANKSYQENK